MAEINVPAWPIPIHQTKFVMSHAQSTGWLLPQMPMPLTTRRLSDTNSSIASRNAAPNPRYQPRDVRFASTIALILSVTDPNVYPGPMIGGVRLELRRRIHQPSSSGFVLRTAARYVVRGRVFNSPSSA